MEEFNLSPENENKISAEKLEEIKETLSKHLHENWKKDIERGFVDKGEDPESERLRTSKDPSGEMDKEWFTERESIGIEFATDENGNKLINTNVHYEDLPPSWQNANIGAATFVAEGVVGDFNNGEDVTTDDYIENYASKIHDKWMEDNDWAKDYNPELFVDYNELPESEKKKDRDQVLLTVEQLV